MQNWDYLHIVVDYEGNNFFGRPRYVNGQELPNWEQGENILSVMNTLGWKGWERVPNTFGLDFQARKLKQQTFIFRRPKAQ
ncbi:MAG: hypothetical protein M3Y68_03380 [Chloroflexota bacterium]|nr:hypothetical protein [Chloroflexota bacterium]